METREIVVGADQISRLHWNGSVLTVVHQQVSPAPEQDWKTVDAAGHLHAYGTGQDPFPSLSRVSDGWADPCENPDCFDEIEYYHLACPQCGEQVWPAPGGPETQVRAGVFQYWIDDERVTHRDALDFMAQLRADDPDRWARLKYWLKYSANLMPRTPRARRD